MDWHRLAEAYRNNKKILLEFPPEVMRGITERQKLILRLRAGLDGPPMTLESCANRLGVSKQRIFQLEKLALRQILRELRRNPSIVSLI
jgi:DNA-directed RNA polymerase sigma subunit (sigma70/sigma32)